MIRKAALSAAVALGILAMGQHASAVTLDTLIGAGPITQGNLTYTNFNETGTLPASAITVTFTSTGVQFTASWMTTPGNDSSIITYNVAPVSGTLSGATLNMANFSVTGTGGAASVGETITDLATKNQYSLSTFFGGAGNSGNNSTESVTFNPEVTNISIIKSIDVAANANSSATLNFVENIYTANSGNPPPVPEPMSLALLPLALAGLALRKKLQG